MNLQLRWFGPDDIPRVEAVLGLPEKDVLRFMERPDTAGALAEADAGMLYGALLYRVDFLKHHVHARPLVLAPGCPGKALVMKILHQYLLGKVQSLKAVSLTVDVPEDDLPQQVLLRDLGLKAVQVVPSRQGTFYRFRYGEGVPQAEGVGVEE